MPAGLADAGKSGIVALCPRCRGSTGDKGLSGVCRRRSRRLELDACELNRSVRRCSRPGSALPLGSDFFQLFIPLLLSRWWTLTGPRCWEKTLRDPRQASHLATRLLLSPDHSKRCPPLAPYDANITALDTSLTHPPSSMPQQLRKIHFRWYVATWEGD